MKSLMIVLALVAYVNADESLAAYEQCLNDTIQFKHCMEEEMSKQSKDLRQELGNFGKEIHACLSQDGVKDVCKLEGLFGPPAGARPFSGPPQGFSPKFAFSTPNPQLVHTCFASVEKDFFSCFIKSSQIPLDVVKALKDRFQELGPGGPAGAHGFGGPGGPGGPPGPFGGPGGFPGAEHSHFVNGSIADIKAKVVEICKGNEDAAKKLMQCGFAAAKPHFTALFSVLHPLALVCKGAGTCDAAKPLSADCKSKLKKAGDSFCGCRDQLPQLVKSNANCAAVADKIDEFEKERPPHMDMCAHKDVDLESACTDVQKKFDEIKKKIESAQH